MIDLMKKLLGILATFYLYLSLTSLSFAQIITITSPENIPTSPGNVINFVVGLFFVFGIVLALVFLMWGGLRWIMSRGDKTKLEDARGQIVAAIVGLVFVVGAFIILNITLQTLTGASLIEGGIRLPTLNNPSTDVLLQPTPTLTPTPTSGEK